MYSLLAIFAITPLYFSHILAPFGVIIGESSSFERQKVLLFLLLIGVAFLETILFRFDIFWARLQSLGLWLMAFLGFPLISALFWQIPLDGSFFLGSYEKHHGYFFYSGLCILFFLLGTLKKPEEITPLVKVSLVSGLFVSFFALLEMLGLSLFFHASGGSWGSGRSISTLGNPNYVAGYLLMLVPLVFSLHLPSKKIIFAIFFLAILSTQSVITLFLLLLSGVWFFLSSSKKTRHIPLYLKITILLCIIFLFLGAGYSSLPEEKILSLVSRFVLMKETLSIMLQYPLSFIFGFGPDSIIHAFDTSRSAIIDLYFPRESAIDSSHNIFIDILFQYGGLMLGSIIFLFSKNWKDFSGYSKYGIVLGLCFLLLNPYILVHMLMLFLLLSIHGNKSA